MIVDRCHGRQWEWWADTAEYGELRTSQSSRKCVDGAIEPTVFGYFGGVHATLVCGAYRDSCLVQQTEATRERCSEFLSAYPLITSQLSPPCELSRQKFNL